MAGALKLSHLDWKVISHVLPYFESAQEGHSAATLGGSVIVEKPPDRVEHADHPEACEQQVKVQEDACGCCRRKEISTCTVVTEHYSNILQ